MSGFLSWPGGKATSETSYVPSSSVTVTRLGMPGGIAGGELRVFDDRGARDEVEQGGVGAGVRG